MSDKTRTFASHNVRIFIGGIELIPCGSDVYEIAFGNIDQHVPSRNAVSESMRLPHGRCKGCIEAGVPTWVETFCDHGEPCRESKQ